MKKNFKSIKATIIMGLLLISMFVAIAPSTSAAILYSLQSYVNAEYDVDITNIPIIPRGTGKAFTINITYGVTVSGGIFNLIGTFMREIHRGRVVTIKIDTFEYPEWASVSISQEPTATVDDIPQTYKATVTVKVDEDAPAFGKGDIKIRITIPKVGLIDGTQKEIEIPFSAGYLPIVDHRFVEGQNKIIGPMDTAVFPIDIINLGNARTKVSFELISIPEGWAAIIADYVFIEEGEGSKAKVYLTIKPPKGFGYHDETKNIVVEYIPRMAERPEFEGVEGTISVLVESRGFSVIGIEVVLLPLIMIIVIIYLLYHFGI